MKKLFSLKENHLFNEVLKKGRKFNSDYILVSEYKKIIDSKESVPKIGISVPKRLGNAVFRNKQKRQIKAILYELLKNNKIKQNTLFVIVVKQKFTNQTFLEKQKILEEIFERNRNGK